MTTIFAIGDIHGHSRLLAALLAWIAKRAEFGSQPPAVYFLGDIVDRGPDSCGALDLVQRTLQRWPDSRLLLGNHDRWFLDFLEGDAAFADALPSWLDQGGEETLASYGYGRGDLPAARAVIRSAHPGHLTLLRNASTMEIAGDYAFVHAGIDPVRPLADQAARECLWIRAPFLRHVGRLSHVVVHGHSPQTPAQPVATENRISLDTGAFFSGVLTVMVLDLRSGAIEFAATDWSGEVRPVLPRRLDRGLGTALDRG